MRKTTQKLREYSLSCISELEFVPLTGALIDEAILKQRDMKAQDSPNPCDVEFLRRWFTDKKMGNCKFPSRTAVVTFHEEAAM